MKTSSHRAENARSLKTRAAGAYVVRSIDGKSSRVAAKTPPPGYVPPAPPAPPAPTARDRDLVRVLLTHRERA